MAAEAPARRTVAIAIDESDCSAKAFDYAVKNVLRPESDDVILIHARPEKHGLYEADSLLLVPSEFFESLEKAYAKKAEKIAREYFKKAEDAKLKALTVVAEGDAREIVVKEAAKVGADLLVAGSRGLGTLKRMWLGSVSEFIIHNAPCPVLIVRPMMSPKGEETEGSKGKTTQICGPCPCVTP